MDRKKASKPLLIHVNVTNTDIESGRRKSRSRCPIAIALCRHSFKRVHVCNYVEVTKNSRRLFGDLPEAALDFITAFDTGYATKPFKFDLRLNAQPQGNLLP